MHLQSSQSEIPKEDPTQVWVPRNIDIRNDFLSCTYDFTRASEDWVLTTFRLVQTVPKLNTFLYCQFGPFFEIHNGPNLIWERFGPTEKLSGLVLHWLYLSHIIWQYLIQPDQGPRGIKASLIQGSCRIVKIEGAHVSWVIRNLIILLLVKGTDIWVPPTGLLGDCIQPCDLHLCASYNEDFEGKFSLNFLLR